MMAGGIVLISVGGILAVTGSLIAVACSGGGCSNDSSTPIGVDGSGNPQYEETGRDSSLGGVGVGLMLGGLAAVGGGIALTVIGSKRVPAKPPAGTTSAAPELLIGPRFTGLRWTM